MRLDSSVDGKRIVCFFAAEYINCETAAVIDCHDYAIRVGVEGDDDADEPDPSYRVVEVKVCVLTYDGISILHIEEVP